MKLKTAFLIIKSLLLITFLVVLFSNLSNIFNFAYDQFNKSIDNNYLESISEIHEKINEINSNVKIEYVEGNNSLNKSALSKTLSESIVALSDINESLTTMSINERYKESQKNLMDAVEKNIDLYNTMELLFTDTYTGESGSQLIEAKNELIFLYQQCTFKTIQFSLPDNVGVFISNFIDEMNQR